MAVTQTTDTRAPRKSSRIIALAAGDTITFLLFSAIGRGSHGRSGWPGGIATDY